MKFISKLFAHSLLLALLQMPALAQALELETPEGTVSTLESIVASDGWTLVMVWSHDCIPCEKQKPMLDAFFNDYQHEAVSVIGVSSDELELRAQALATLNRTTVSFDNFLFAGETFHSAFQKSVGQPFVATPTYMIFGPGGVLEVVNVGPVSRKALDAAFAERLKL